jgi:hypothetical protein
VVLGPGAYLGDVEGVDEDGGDDGGSGRRNGAFGESHGPLGRWRGGLRGSPRGGHGEEGEGRKRCDGAWEAAGELIVIKGLPEIAAAWRNSGGNGEEVEAEEFARVDTAALSSRVHQTIALERRGSKATTPAAPCAVAVTTWHPCSDVFPSRVFGIKKVLYP